MNINFIKDTYVKGDSNVLKKDLIETLKSRPNLPKDRLPLFNCWDEQKRGGYSDNAKTSMLILDYDNGVMRKTVLDLLKDYEFYIYNSSSNDTSNGIERFRVLLPLKEEICAIDLKDYKKKLAKNVFGGVDRSTFDIGRFFKIPSKYDKGGEEVKIYKHSGKRFDFYALCPKKAHNEITETFKKIVDEMKFGKLKKTNDIDKAVEDFQKWMLSIFPMGCHYADVPYIAAYAKGHGIDFWNAEQKLKAHYAGGHSKDAIRWLKKIYIK